MKHLNKLLFVAALWTMSSCSDLTELDLLDNPNAVTPDNAGVDFLYNEIQLAFRDIFFNYNFSLDGLVRLTHENSFTYIEALPEQEGNGMWYNSYARLFPDIEVLLNLSAERGLDIHAGSAKIMKAWALTSLVDVFGDVPNTQALQGTDVISPAPDPGQDVYAAAEALLDEAIADLTGTQAARPANDSYYGGSAAKWATLAKTLKLRIYNNTRLVDGSAGQKIAALVAAGDLIDTEDEDFQFNYGNQRTNPNSRHPFYNDSYETADGTYMANYMMWLLCCEKEVRDPRTRFYFYRQVDDAIGQDVTVYSCILSNFPTDLTLQDPQLSHFAAVDPNLPYCVADPSGYYGRDHMNGSGIPPDGPIRTVYGLYPGGGRWDGNFFEFAQQEGTTGALGQGIAPIMLSSWVDFMRAEAALTAGSGEDARALLESAIRKHVAKVLGFAARSPVDLSATTIDRATGEVIPLADFLLPDQDDIDTYVNNVLSLYDNATDKLDVVMKEYLISLLGNGLDAFNMYRRTGKPNNMMPGIDNQAIDAFPRSLLLPSDHVNLNSNVTQKSGLGELVFWDTGQTTLR